MSDLLIIIMYSFFSGITVFLGGVFSFLFERYFKESPIKRNLIHSFMAFGGGIIIAAVAFVLVPKAIEILGILAIVLSFLSGALFFLLLDRYIEKKAGNISQVLVMLVDFIPEAIALGAVFATDHKLGLLLAIFIGLQNFPEAFNSYGDLRKNHYSVKKCLIILFFLSFLGIISALLGNMYLSNMPELTSSLMLFASGGILYLVFQDIAPLAKVKKSYFPALGVNFGFLLGIIGHKLLG